VRRVLPIATRELQSFFVSPVAYVVLTLWSVLAGSFFLSSLLGFLASEDQARRLAALGHAGSAPNLNDGLVLPFLGSMWIVMLFLLPAVTMGLFASEKSNGTEELLLTSPLTGWDIVLGKFLAGSAFACLMIAIVAFFPSLLFMYGNPEVGRTGAGLLGLFLVSLTYVAVGGFASSLTRNQLVSFMLTLVILLVLGLLLPFIIDVGAAAGAGERSALGEALNWVATGRHTERLLTGLVDTADLAYFVIVTTGFLLMTRTAVESVRWR
jgi:ABC-2 type transport system permease protein